MTKEELVNYLINNPDKRKQLDELCKVNNLNKEEVLKLLTIKYKELVDEALDKLPGVHKDKYGNYHASMTAMPVFLEPKLLWSTKPDNDY